MLPEQFSSLFTQHLPFEATQDQTVFIKKISDFVFHKEANELFVLKGYAGTGKTTLIGALVNILPSINMKSLLMAPTGRAAKVMSKYSKRPAFTIHSKIYKLAPDAFGNIKFSIQTNKYTNTLFIVDEASMIGDSYESDGNLFGGRSLLEDLFSFVYSGENCKLLLVGDTAQLPPVKLEGSPALDIEYLSSSFGMNIDSVELKEVMRQADSSGILINATKLRLQMLEMKSGFPEFEVEGFSDIERLPGSELQEALQQSYTTYGADETIVLCRSNKRANIYNQQIRALIRWQESDISIGDYLMVVRNNYHWLPADSKADFIANGDTVIITRIKKREEMYGFSFADVTLKMIDYEDEEFDAKIILNSIMSESASLTYDENKKLYESVLADYMEIENKSIRYQKIKKDPYYNALQVKFAYAVTCHKAQGGQWKSVFIEQGYLTDEMMNIEFLRWLYTALTRATEKLYLVNFKDEFFNA